MTDSMLNLLFSFKNIKKFDCELQEFEKLRTITEKLVKLTLIKKMDIFLRYAKYVVKTLLKK